MNHEHLPALNKYTSPNQYAALQEVEKSGSIINLITQGRMGTTIGALMRSAWMDSETLTAEDGATSERWFVTQAGKHAMKLYEAKQEQERQKQLAREETQRLIREAKEYNERNKEKAFDMMVEYYIKKMELEKQIKEQWEAVSTQLERAHVKKDEFEIMKTYARKKAGIEERGEYSNAKLFRNQMNSLNTRF